MRLVVLLSLLILLRSPAAATDFATEMMDATFKVDTGGQNISTCFVVRREVPDKACYLVTAAHTFEGVQAESVTLVLRSHSPDGSYERHECAVAIQKMGKPLWVRSKEHDVAVLRLPDTLPVPVPALPASALATKADLMAADVHLCSPLYLLGFPKRLEADPSGLPVARAGIFASPPLLPMESHPTFLANITAFGGDSGGPIFMAGSGNHPLLIGLAFNQQYYEEDGTTTALGALVVLHSSFIRETLEVAAQQAEASPP